MISSLRIGPTWTPFSPWTTHHLGDVYVDPAGGPRIERVMKLCRDAQGEARPRGCGLRYEGWAFSAGQKILFGIPLTVRRQLTEDGAILGLCDSCIARVSKSRVMVSINEDSEPELGLERSRRTYDPD